LFGDDGVGESTPFEYHETFTILSSRRKSLLLVKNNGVQKA